MSQPSQIFVTCATCLKLHKTTDPLLTNPVCARCRKPKINRPARPR